MVPWNREIEDLADCHLRWRTPNEIAPSHNIGDSRAVIIECRSEVIREGTIASLDDGITEELGDDRLLWMITMVYELNSVCI